MFKKLFNICWLVVAGLIIGINAFSQVPVDPTDNYNLLLPGIYPVGGGTDSVCPSITGDPSTFTFQVEVNNADPGASWFEWVVYGGTIIDNNGTINPGNNAVPDNFGGIPYFYIAHDNYTSGQYSTITVQWHTAEISNAWVAVRQHSQWDCYEGPWRVFTNDIFNKKPVISSFPTDITIAFDDRLNFILPQPVANDEDACPLGLTYTYQVTGVSAHGPTVSTDDASRTIALGVGVNTVTWTISDGMKDSIRSYTITVDPMPQITHISWINPVCDNDAGGRIYISDTLNYAFTPPLEYSFNGGSYTQTRFYEGLLAGSYTLQARVVYPAYLDHNGALKQTTQYSSVYSCTLRDPEPTSVNSVPTQPFITAVPPNCASSNDGYIYVNPGLMTPNNRSFSFNGTSDYISLNKYYNTELAALSIAAWIKLPNASIPSDGVIVSFNNARHFQLKVTASTSGGISRVRFETVTPSGDLEYVEPSTKINDGLWHLVVATFNNGVRTVYIDGVAGAASTNTSTAPTLGSNAAASYGAIGARMASSSFGATPEGNYFTGNMTDLGLWESALDAAAVVGILKSGIGSAGPSAYWITNDLPSIVSPTQSAVFSDIGNLGNPNEWGRVVGGGLSPNDAPVLYNWTPDSYPNTSLDSIPSGSYTLTVLDNFNCPSSAVSQTYTLTNSDQDPPLILVNMALTNNTAQWGRATQSGDGTYGSCGTTAAHLAVDGSLDTDPNNCSVAVTDGGDDEWWQINLGAPYNIRQVRIRHSSTGAPVDFYVMISQFPMSALGDTARANVTEQHYVGTPPAMQDFTFNNNNTQYIRINAVGTGVVLMLAEVEALALRPSPFARTLYLGDDDCSFVVGSYDGSIDPVAYDNCGTIDKYTHDQVGLDYDYSLYGMDFPLGTTPVVWRAIDDSPDTTLLTVNYTVVDTIRPQFVPADIRNGARDTVTFCVVADSLRIPIPNATDNYNCAGDYHFTSMRLRINGSTVKLYNGTEYDPHSIIDSLAIAPNLLAAGASHRFVWEVTDYSNYTRQDSFWVYVQTKPAITDLHYADVSCNGADDGLININSVAFQAGETVTYYRRTATDTLSQPGSVFTGLEPKTYYAWIVVDGCKSAEYQGGSPIIISQPNEIDPKFSLTPVQCFGDSGKIDVYLEPTSSQVLHLLGGATNVISVPNYPELDLGASGTVEAMVYFDTISAASTNSEAGIVYYSGGYGLRMSGGFLTLDVGGTSLTTLSAIPVRTWTHVAGVWDATGTYLYINGAPVGSGATASNTATGGSLFIGCLGAGAEETNLRGFVRFARVWSTALSSVQMSNNSRFIDPINYTNSLAANFPIIVNQGTVLQNRSPYIIPATLVTANATWQSYAFYWSGISTPHISRFEDLAQAPAQQYNYSIQSPFCRWDSIITLAMTDNKIPVLRFFEEDGSTINLTSTLTRRTSQVTNPAWGINPDLVNLPGDCWYMAQGTPRGEFDPLIDDSPCPASTVTLTWAYADSSLTSEGTGSNSLNGLMFTDTVVVNWQAIDGTGINVTNKTITYIARDDEFPTLTYTDSTVNAIADSCFYRVPNATTFVPTVADNCTEGTLWNNYSGGGYGSHLNNVTIPVGVDSITWIYRDKYNNPDTIVQRIEVVDNQPPIARCLDISVDLNASGTVSIDSSRINNGSSDNCNRIKDIDIIKNIAKANRTVTVSTEEANSCGFASPGMGAVDGNVSPLYADCYSFLSAAEDNPYWYVRLLGAAKRIYGIRIYSGGTPTASPLTNFRVQVSTFPSFATSSFDTTYTGAAVAGNIYFSIPNGVVGSFVRVLLNGTGVQLGLAEVEIYGHDNGGDASQLTFGCEDVRYSGTPGVFNPIDVMMRVTDQRDLLATCWSNVTVRDVSNPVVIPRNPVLSPDVSGIVTLVASDLYTSATDACGIETAWCVPNQFDCGDEGENAVDLHVIDVNGNEVILPVSVTVQDTVPPTVVIYPAVRLYIGSTGFRVINPQTDIDNGSYDNCGGTSGIALYESNPDTVQCSDVGSFVPIEYRITDFNNNTTIHNFLAEVLDTLAPIVSTNNFTLYLPDSGDTVVYFSDFDNSSLDNCGAIPVKALSFDNGSTWCPAGQEAILGATPPSLNRRDSIVSVEGSTAFWSNPVGLAVDASGTSTAYITDGTTGVREVRVGFNTPYVFTSVGVYWHTDPNLLGLSKMLNTTSTTTSTTAGTYNPGGNPYAVTNIRDNNRSTVYISNRQNATYNYVEYDFGSISSLDSFRIYWHEQEIDTDNTYDCKLPLNAYVRWGNTAGTLSADLSNYIGTSGPGGSGNGFSFPGGSTGRYVRIYFNRAGGTSRGRVGIQDLNVYGIADEVDCELPVNGSGGSLATVQYYNGSWQNLGAGTIGATGGVYNTLGSFSVVTDSIRIRFDRTVNNRRIGIKDVRFDGYPIGSASGCLRWDCDSVWTTQNVLLLYEDSYGNSTTVPTQFDIEPNFGITEIQLKDCAVDGEQYWSWVDNRPADFSYYWTQQQNPPTWPNLFSTLIGGDTGDNEFYSESDTIAQLRTGRNVTPDDRYYTINLLVTDRNNGCWDDLDYTFWWDNTDGGGAQSVKPWEVCIGDTVTFNAELTEPQTYWSSLTYTWDPDIATPIAGGTGFPNYTVAFNANDTTDVVYGVRGVQEYVRFGNNGCDDFPTVGLLPVGTIIDCDEGGPCYDFGTDITGPFILSEATQVWTANYDASGRNVIRLNSWDWDWRWPSGWGWYANDCGTYWPCDEGVRFHTTVYDVSPPVFDSPILDVCPCDTITYSIDTTYTSHDWTVTGGDIILGGSGNDNYATVVWSCGESRVWDGDSVASVTLEVFNPLGCSDDSTIVVNFDNDWNSIPTITCPNDTIHAASVGSCRYTFPNLPVPVVGDQCRVYSLVNNFNGTGNARGTYNLGQTIVNWTVRDYVGNDNTCAQTVTIIDDQTPQLTNTPIDIPIDAGINCDTIFPDNSRELFAYDNCDTTGNFLHYLTEIDYLDDGSIEASYPGIKTIQGLNFELGPTSVHYTVTDTADTWNSGTGPNSRTTSFLVIVEDHRAPDFNPLPDILLTNSPDSCASNIDVPYPDTVTYCSDNCTAAGNIRIRFVLRSDGRALNEPFPIDTTIINWEAEDDAIPSNKRQQTQRVIVRDTESPTMQPLSNDAITYCEIDGHRLRIPVPDDNCQVDTLIVNVVNIPPTLAYSFGDTITTVGFNPFGDGLTGVIPVLEDDAEYEVTWRAIDHAGNSTIQVDTLRVEIQPSFPLNAITWADLKCGGTLSGIIDIGGVIAEDGATIEYTIDGGSHWYPFDHYEGLDRGTYVVQARVNGCTSEVDTVVITAPDPYWLDGTVVNPYCEFGSEGSIDVIMTGGAPAQLAVSGTGATVANYPGIAGGASGMIEAWVYLNSANTNATILSNGNYSLGLDGGFFSLTVGGSTFTLLGTNGVGDFPEIERWYHVAGSWTPTETEIWVNSTRRGNWGGVTPAAGGGLAIGGGFDGIIREVRVWNADYTTVVAEYGDPAGRKVAGGENNLGGCWPLIDNTSPSINRVTGGAVAFIGGGGSWTSVMPQPGTYSWSRPGGWTNDSINISGLIAGAYTLNFVDNYLCPTAAGLDHTFYLYATDDLPPVITDKAPQTLSTDAGDCSHIIVPTDTITLLPTISNTDGFDCSWTTTWDVYSEFDGSGWTGRANLVGYELQQGLNRITVNVTQNRRTVNSIFNVFIEDDDPPEAHAETVAAIILNSEVGNGNTSIAAADFNNDADNSFDNCSDFSALRFEVSRDGGLTFSDSARFDCIDITDPVSIVLRVWDEVNLYDDSEPQGGLTIVDNTAPVFLREARLYDANCATANDVNGLGYVVGVEGLTLTPWVDYGDNCDVGLVEYRIEHTTHPEFNYPDPGDPTVWVTDTGTGASGETFHQGISNIFFRVTDLYGNVSIPTVMLQVNVLAMPTPGAVGGD